MPPPTRPCANWRARLRGGGGHAGGLHTTQLIHEKPARNERQAQAILQARPEAAPYFSEPSQRLAAALAAR